MLNLKILCHYMMNHLYLLTTIRQICYLQILPNLFIEPPSLHLFKWNWNMQTRVRIGSEILSSVDILNKNEGLAETFRVIFNLLGLCFVLVTITYNSFPCPHAPRITYYTLFFNQINVITTRTIKCILSIFVFCSHNNDDEGNVGDVDDKVRIMFWCCGIGLLQGWSYFSLICCKIYIQVIHNKL